MPCHSQQDILCVPQKYDIYIKLECTITHYNGIDDGFIYILVLLLHAGYERIRIFRSSIAVYDYFLALDYRVYTSFIYPFYSA